MIERRVIEHMKQQHWSGAAIELVPDGTQQRGGAVFETSRGLLDASIETQLQEIERGLADQLQRRA